MTTDKLSAYALRMMEALAAIKRRKPARGVTGVMPCPNCGEELHYYIDSRNGHARAYCKTKGCVEFIE